jgi:uncharacterized protein YndB with AHSA1/START domain
MKKVLWGLGALLLIGLSFLGIRYAHIRSAARLWEGPVEEILSEKLEKHANTMEVEFSSRVDAPVEAVFAAFSECERLQEFADTVRYSKLLTNAGNRKVVEIEMVTLGQPQRSVMEFSFLPEEKVVQVRTVENAFADMNGEYRFFPSPDGTKTLLTYTGRVTDKTDRPIPSALQKSALRETFVSVMRALKKRLATQYAITTP